MNRPMGFQNKHPHVGVAGCGIIPVGGGEVVSPAPVFKACSVRSRGRETGCPLCPLTPIPEDDRPRQGIKKTQKPTGRGF